jgi:hypothetical protein
MNECFFCGPTVNSLTEEHVWPRWVSRLLFGKYDSNHFVNVRSTGDSTTGLWRSRNIDVTTETVCSSCNNVGLSSFENTKIKPIATPLITANNEAVLSPGDQWKLAAWAHKMALLLEVAIPPNERAPLFFTPAERQQFRDTTLANERVRIFLSNYDCGQHPGHAHLPTQTLTEREGERKSFDLKIFDLVYFCPACRGSVRSKRKAISSRINGGLEAGHRDPAPESTAEGLRRIVIRHR